MVASATTSFFRTLWRHQSRGLGSFNLDYWSDRRNLEVSVTALDRGAAAALEQQFLRDLEGAREVRLESWSARSWPRRFVGWLAYLLFRL